MVRDVFHLAKENVPAIIFIDEIDAIATARFDAQSGADRENQRILMELLNQVNELAVLSQPHGHVSTVSTGTPLIISHSVLGFPTIEGYGIPITIYKVFKFCYHCSCAERMYILCVCFLITDGRFRSDCQC